MTPADPGRVVVAARSWLGTPYHDQASRRGVGCDCLGLVRGVWREVVGEEPLPVPPYSRDWGEVSNREVLAEAAAAVTLPADPARLELGMLLLFRIRRGAVAKHCGIVTERGTFIHVYERLGVIEEALTEAWRRRIAFAFLFPRVNGNSVTTNPPRLSGHRGGAPGEAPATPCEATPLSREAGH